MGAPPAVDVDVDRGGPDLVLATVGLSVSFGGIRALTDVTFDVRRHEICSVIGPNGAGKTTLFNAISGFYTASAGSVRMGDIELLALAPHERAALGIARTFQNLALWPTLTVLENVMMGAHHRGRKGFASAPFGIGVGREERRLRSASMALLERLGIDALAARPCSGLPYGTLKRVELARALAGSPSLLLLDEPASGLTHGEVGELGDLIVELRRERGFTILLVEHHMGMVMRISDRVVALDFGEQLVQGTPAEVQRDERVVRAYLGAPA